jgi:nucleoside-diphosphate-sugar epimerase
MKILILGSSGQVGSNLISYLKIRNYEVAEFDIVNDSEQDLRITPNPLLEEEVKNSDFVIFLAFDVGGSRYLQKYQNSFEFVNNNILLMNNTFNLLKKYNKKFVFASSQMSNMSHSTYGVLKNIGDKYTKSLGGLIFKLWNCYGYEADEEKSHVITDFIKMGFENKKITMLTDGTEERDFLYDEDCSEAIEVLIKNYDKFNSDDNIHITTFKYTKIIDIAYIIKENFKNLGIDIEVLPSTQKDNVQKNKKNLPDEFFKNWWEPKTTIEDGISNIFNIYKKEYGY